MVYGPQTYNMKQLSYYTSPLSIRSKSADHPQLAPSRVLYHILLDGYHLSLKPLLDKW